MRIFCPFWIRFNLFPCYAICFSAWQFMILIKERACMLLTGRMFFSYYTKKRILFYHAKGSHARSHHAHAQSHTSLHTFCSCSFRLSRSTALQFMASTLHRAQLLNYTRAGVRRYSKSETDTYMRCTRITFNCNTRVVHVKRNGPCTVRSTSVRGPFKTVKCETDRARVVFFGRIP